MSEKSRIRSKSRGRSKSRSKSKSKSKSKSRSKSRKGGGICCRSKNRLISQEKKGKSSKKNKPNRQYNQKSRIAETRTRRKSNSKLKSAMEIKNEGRTEPASSPNPAMDNLNSAMDSLTPAMDSLTPASASEISLESKSQTRPILEANNTQPSGALKPRPRRGNRPWLELQKSKSSDSDSDKE